MIWTRLRTMAFPMGRAMGAKEKLLLELSGSLAEEHIASESAASPLRGRRSS